MELPDALQNDMRRFGQAHLIDHWKKLNESQRVAFQHQLEQIDFALIESLLKSTPQVSNWSVAAQRAQPPESAFGIEMQNSAEGQRAIQVGQQALSRGQVAVVLVAGGQGTRLGFDQPKGMFPIGPLSGRTLFQVLVDKVRGMAQRWGAAIPVLIMTSPATHAATLEYFAQNDRLGLSEQDLIIFCQGTMPAVDSATGRILLEGVGRLALSPDGHGGMLQALARAKIIERLAERGIEYLFYGQIDNPLTQLGDALTLGLHQLRRSEMTTQVVCKYDPLQRVGNVVSLDGRLHVIEYSDIPDSVAQQLDADGRLRLWAGNIAVHVFDLSFLRRVRDEATALPFHLATKKVPFMNDEGRVVSPAHPNAIKFERFIFDLLPAAQRSLVVEIDPADGFAAVKNSLDAATENARTAQSAMVAQHARWLRACGASVAPGIPVEIHPLFAVDADQLAGRIAPGTEIRQPTYYSP